MTNKKNIISILILLLFLGLFLRFFLNGESVAESIESCFYFTILCLMCYVFFQKYGLGDGMKKLFFMFLHGLKYVIIIFLGVVILVYLFFKLGFIKI